MFLNYSFSFLSAKNNAIKNMIVHIKTPIVLMNDVSAAQTSRKRAPIIIPIA
jgi:hypothetical protein